MKELLDLDHTKDGMRGRCATSLNLPQSLPLAMLVQVVTNNSTVRPRSTSQPMSGTRRHLRGAQTRLPPYTRSCATRSTQSHRGIAGYLSGPRAPCHANHHCKYSCHALHDILANPGAATTGISGGGTNHVTGQSSCSARVQSSQASGR